MRRSFKLFGVATLIVLAVAFIYGVLHVQAIEDWYRLRDYSPPAAIVKIADEDQLTPHAKHILYVTRPVLQSDAAKFRQECPQSEKTIVLGCYKSNVPFTSDSVLFVYNVADPRLHGVQQVTEAHEMLHAAYDRLSSSEKKKVEAMLTDYYNHNLHDQRIISTINSYKQSEPNDVVNEMHSVFGTEIASLPAPLENYYKQYFVNRGAVTGFAAGYEGEFTSRINQIKDDDDKLALLKQQIDAQEQQLAAQLADIQSQRSGVERSNDASRISQYNAKVAAYNNGVRSLQEDINTYNSLVNERNSLATEIRSLQSALDSRLTPQSTR